MPPGGNSISLLDEWRAVGLNLHCRSYGSLEAPVVDGSVRQHGRRNPRMRPGCLVGDRGHGGHRVRRHNERWGWSVDQVSYRERNRVECCVHRRKQLRCVATRYEQYARSISG